MMAMNGGAMGGQQWMWWILIILFAFGGFGNGMFGNRGGAAMPNSAATSDTLSHQLSDCCCQTQLRMQDHATGIREQATANQFQNQQEFCDIKTRMAANHCETLAAIQANQAAIIGYMTQEKISGLERENAALTMQLSQNAQTRAIIEALSKTSTTTPTA